MNHLNRLVFYLATGLILLTGLSRCKSSEPFSGFSYDPAGSTETSTKPITPQHKRLIGVDGIRVSNQFAGARLSDFYKKNDTLYQAVIKPEITPVNDSPWYAFKTWAKRDTTVWIELTYKGGHHRYVPKLSRDKKNWRRIKTVNYRPDATNGTAYLRLHLTPQPLWISGQELITQNDFDRWADSLAQRPFITQDTAGYSHQHRPIRRLKMDAVPAGRKKGVLIITGRLHPPEVTGNIACFTFVETLTADTKLARSFRKHFEVIAYPFSNPDGVQNGHWRTNGGGVDLNRDWQAFNQPETQAIRDDLIAQLKANPQTKVYYGMDFHSTNENIFYPIDRDVQTFPDDFTYAWVNAIIEDFPEVDFAVEPFDTSGPITKNWIYKTFGADAVTYEVNDRADRDTLRAISQKSAELIMQKLLRIKQDREP